MDYGSGKPNPLEATTGGVCGLKTKPRSSLCETFPYIIPLTEKEVTFSSLRDTGYEKWYHEKLLWHNKT